MSFFFLSYAAQKTYLKTKILSLLLTLSSIKWKSRTILAEFSKTPGR